MLGLLFTFKIIHFFVLDEEFCSICRGFAICSRVTMVVFL